MRKLIDYSESEIDKINAIVSNVDDFELEGVKEGNSSIVRDEKYSGLSPIRLVAAAHKELERRKEWRKEERTERLIKIAETRTTELLKILAHIANTISNKPKTALAVVILIPIAISVLISLINFIGYQLWLLFIAPYLNGLGVAVK